MTRVWVRRRNTSGFSKWHLKNPDVCSKFTITECGASFDTSLCEVTEGVVPNSVWTGQVCDNCKWIATEKYPVFKVVPITMQVTIPENIGMIDLQNLLLKFFSDEEMKKAKIQRITLSLPTNVWCVVETKGP